MRNEKKDKLLQYAKRVWLISYENEDFIINEAIAKTEAFFRSLGIKTKLHEHGIEENIINEIVKRFRERNTLLGENKSINSEKVLEILTLCK